MRKVWPSGVVAADLADELRRRCARPPRSATAGRRRTRTARRCRTRTTARCPPRRPMPITANGNVGFERPQRGLDARVGEPRSSSRSVTSIGASPSTSRAAMRRNSRRLNRRSPARRWSTSVRHCRSPSAASTSSSWLCSRDELVVVAERLDERRVGGRGVAEHAARAEEPARALGRAGGVAERRRPATDARVGPSASRRSWSRPRSGSGVGREPARGSRAAAAG